MSAPGEKRQRSGALVVALVWMALAAPAEAAGQLLVQSAPEGATVRVDGQAVGRAPLLLEVAQGRYAVELALKGHLTTRFNAQVVDGLTTRRRVALKPVARWGGLALRSSPAGATVYVDGVRRGKTPLRLSRLTPGAHSVTLVKPGRQTQHRRAIVRAGATASMHAALPVVAPRQVAVKPAARPQARPVVAAAPPRRAATPAPAAPAIAMPTSPTMHAPPAAVAPPAVLPVPASVSVPAMSWPDVDPRPWLFWALLALLGLAVGLASRRHAADEPETVRGPRGVGIARPGHPAWPALAEAAWEDAEGVLKAAVQGGEADAWAYYHLGVALQAQSRTWEAEGAYRTALRLEPEHRDAAFNLATTLSALGQTPQALIAYRQLLARHPGDVDALHNLGHLYQSLGLADEAAAYWQRAREAQHRGPALKAAQRRIGPDRSAAA